tara:strand:+ start:206 stop:382 length:177 start_codon:yes stop_codon:yes gene_type:complete
MTTWYSQLIGVMLVVGGTLFILNILALVIKDLVEDIIHHFKRRRFEVLSLNDKEKYET